MILASERETIHLLPNPGFRPQQPFSYEDVLCRLAGWWTVETSTLSVREVITLHLAS